MRDEIAAKLDYDRNIATVKLPVSGVEAVLQEAIGGQERAFLKRGTPVYQAIPDYLCSMLVTLAGRKPTIEDLLALYVPDQEFLLVEACKLNSIDGIWEFRFRCGANLCGQWSEHTYDLNQLPVMQAPDKPTIELILPRTKKTAVVAMLTGKQERLLMDQAASTGADLNQADYQCLASLNGKTDFTFIEVENLPFADHKAIRKARQQLTCGYDTAIGVICPHCGNRDRFNILMHPDFLFWGG